MSAFFGFKSNPKRQVEDKAHRLFGRDARVDVRGTRLSPLECKTNGIPQGHYFVEIDINGQLVATAHTKNWRKAYGLLLVEVEKAYERTTLTLS